MTLDLPELRRLLAEAKPMLWDVEALSPSVAADVALIVALRNAAPELLAAAEERDRLREALREPDGDPDYMCPNCLTPWKCNWPHILEPES